MHEKGYGHLDIKPVNILLDKSGDDFIPILADMGSCIKLKNSKQKRGHFTWTYAHPELRDLASNPDSIKKHGLRASAEIKDHGKVVSYDLYALGKTIQQILAIIENHFGEMSYSDYSFRYMHIISALLLDGKNSIDASKKRENVFERDRIEFITDFPMGLHDSVFVEKKITSAKILVEKLKRHSHDYSISALAEEFGMRNSQIINNTIGEMVPFSKRVSKVFNHPIVKRLYGELQLGIMTEVYPGASHNRWSHSVGVYSLVLKYYISLLSDPDNPLLRIIIDKSDIDHAIIASILHDVGQTALCHDMEMVNNTLFNHMSFIQDLVDEEYLASAPLSKTINDKDNSLWGEIDFKRVISIINGNSSNLIDYVASDMINSPIDADKLDYIMRDSYYCGVAYGDGIDISRILNSLTVKEEKGKIRLAYYTKGRTAISSMLLARYQLYGAVYWHHTFRCLHAMIFYATQLAFGQNKPIFQINSKVGLSEIQMRKLYYYRVICKRPWNDCWDRMHKNFNSAIFNNIPAELKDEFSIGNNDYALDLIYKFTNKDGKALLKNIINRDLFKRIYSKSLFDIGVAEFPDLQNQCKDRVRVSKDIQKKLLEAARDEQTKSQRTETAAEIIMSNELKQFESDIENQLLILVDFPLKITIPKNSWPTEVDDSTRKLQNYISNDSNDSTVILDSSNNLLTQLACLRIYSEPAFFRIITRYLTPGAIEACVKNVITVF
jgi:serine/threonine protein kinase